MQVYIFTDNNALEKNISTPAGKQDFPLAFYPCTQLRKVLKNPNTPLLVYLDIRDQEATFKKDLTYLLKKKDIYLGILDPQGVINDCGELFQQGVVDYIAKTRIKELLTPKRFEAVASYLENFRKDYSPQTAEFESASPLTAKHIKVSGWDQIHSGQEHTFYLLYAEIDQKDELEKKYNKANLATALEVYKKYLERHIVPYNGRIWMWYGFGGVALFPYDGKSCAAALSGFKIMLYQFLHQVEESMFPHLISFRLALHIGDFVYQETQTGHIISDTINSLFHLGKIYTKPGNFTVTEQVMPAIPWQIKDYFIPAGEFEKHNIFRMQQPLFMGGNHTTGR